MSLYGVMRTSASGMSAQASRLATISDNISNSSTTGYKRASTEFSTLVLEASESHYTSGGVETNVRRAVSEQGALSSTSSTTDLAVSGEGFFLVSAEDGSTYLTRAGSFVEDGEGNLVNAAGYKLMAYSLANGSASVVANGTAGLEAVNLGTLAMQANASTEGSFNLNLPSDATTVVAANFPSANAATAEYSGKTSLVVYDNLGAEVTLDIYTAKTAANTWEVSVYNAADAGAGGTFPYSAAALSTQTLTFDATTGNLAAASATSVSVAVPNGGTVVLDMGQTSQLATSYTVIDAEVNGNAASAVESIEIADDGTLFAVYENGSRVATYQIPLAKVVSPDKLAPVTGNAYQTSQGSGDLQIGFAGSSGYGTIESNALEQSTVDIATELTTMIETQRNYTANSKVFQTGADLLEVLVNLKR